MTRTFFQVIAHYQTHPGEEEAVARLLGSLAAASRTEPANLSYEFFQNLEDPSHFVILEQYTDAAGFAAHRETSHFQEIGAAQIIPKLADRRIQSFEDSADA
ncbi:putative quinol monooxygenase [Arthrobacter sp. Helios]|uniref:putative quinol monooxygenase n=1 Tax=Arthrobacter sp. Helios TaxID=2828862 RepID=UPI002069282B|nr:putative quinol monooxygenase [Arthrobacter sp. Helios]UPO76786.1 antibiotic biosynthesis monooxygenase [Arthrobacter sp. Helios]